MVERLAEKLVEGLAENQKKILRLIARNPHLSKNAMAESLGISTTAIDKNLAKLKQKASFAVSARRKAGNGRWADES